MKRIVIFCDGTWNSSDAARATNVVKLAQAVCPLAPDGTVQQVFYYPGVGSGQGSTGLSRLLDRYGGGAFGWGLDDKIHQAFRDLVFCYEPGDMICIFGFSRGAFTARSLAGLIRKAGIPARSQIPAIPEAIRQYRRRDPASHPESEEMRRYRAHLSPATATSEEDLAWRQANGYGDAILLRLGYLGIWDTVGGLGLPGMLGFAARLLNRRYRFHDTDLSRSVAAARHALALDERRKLYPYTPWANLDKLNGETTGEERPYRQLWFVGTHSVVGGSGPLPPLSAYPLRWVAEGAMARGVAFDEDLLDELAGRADAAVPGEVTQARGAKNLWGFLLGARRLAPTKGERHGSVEARRESTGYEPAAR